MFRVSMYSKYWFSRLGCMGSGVLDKGNVVTVERDLPLEGVLSMVKGSTTGMVTYDAEHENGLERPVFLSKWDSHNAGVSWAHTIVLHRRNNGDEEWRALWLTPSSMERLWRLVQRAAAEGREEN